MSKDAEKVQDTAAKEPSFEEQIDAAVQNNTERFYKDALKQAGDVIKSQGKQIEEMQRQQIEFRDDIAIRCFVPLIDKVTSYDLAANTAYQAADAFLRARENGMMVTEDITED